MTSGTTYDRRALLRAASALGALALLPRRATSAPLRLLRAPRARAGANLLLVQLSGGNDGLATVVPRDDDSFRRVRPTLMADPSRLLALDERRALHPALGRLRAHFDAGRVAVVEGVGYPGPSRSHFRSLEIWHTASTAGRVAADEGWVGRLVGAAFEEPSATRVVHFGESVPYSLRSSTHPPAAVTTPEAYRWIGTEHEVERWADRAPASGSGARAFVLRTVREALDSSAAIRSAVASHRTSVVWPGDDLSRSLRAAAACLHAGIGCRVASVETSGFDTHEQQLRRHDMLMARLDAALGALLDDLAASEEGRRTVVLVFSEFGRRVEENATHGTDHGKASVAFVLGHEVRGGAYGTPPALDALDGGDLAYTTDFRSLYATLAERGFGVRHEAVLGERFPLLGFLRGA